jgi:Ala-tRNA(Pro) deacylase
MPIKRIRQFLENENIPYAIIPHEPAFTSQTTAAAAHVSGRQLAKTVIVKIDAELAMAVLPADFQLDLEHLREAAGSITVELATEWEFKDRFSDCEAGAMPPFGNLYGMRVYVADVLAGDEYICFNACNHRELIRMRYDDFDWCVRPNVVDIVWARV